MNEPGADLDEFTCDHSSIRQDGQLSQSINITSRSVIILSSSKCIICLHGGINYVFSTYQEGNFGHVKAFSRHPAVRFREGNKESISLYSVSKQNSTDSTLHWLGGGEERSYER